MLYLDQAGDDRGAGHKMLTGHSAAIAIDAARRLAKLAVAITASDQGFPSVDGYLAASAASRTFSMASRDTTPYAAVGVINSWQTQSAN